MLTLRGLRRVLRAATASTGPLSAPTTRAVHGSALWSPHTAVSARHARQWAPPGRACHSVSGRSLSSKATTDTPQLTKRQRKIQSHWNVHRAIVVDKTPLPEVFARLRHEVARRGDETSIRLRQAIDVFYFNCAQQAPTLDAEFLDEIIAYFEDSLLQPAQQRHAADPSHALSDSLNDGVFAAVVRLLLAKGDRQRAWEMAQVTATVTSGKVHFRSVGPILDFECREGHFVSALEHWRQLKQQEMEWTKTMEDTLVQMVIACQRHYHHDSSAPANAAHVDMAELLRDLRLACREISPDNASRLRHVFQACGFFVKSVPDNESVTPQCSACGTTLTKDTVSPSEHDKIVQFIETNVPLRNKNVTMSTKEFLTPFKRWLLAKHASARARGKLHFILDGPNIAYLNQNFDHGRFRFDHVDRVVDMLEQEGHTVSITIPSPYLEATSRIYIRTRKAKEMRRQHGKVATRQLTPEDAATIARWRSRNLLFSCRTEHLTDDMFWLYASALLGDQARVVTNDQGRDHVFTLLSHRTSGMTTSDLRDEHRLSMDLLDRWRETAIVNIEIQHGELSPAEKLMLDKRGVNSGIVIPIESIKLMHPTPFSRVPQLSATGHELHFPIADAHGAPSKWLCVHRPKTDTS